MATATPDIKAQDTNKAAAAPAAGKAPAQTKEELLALIVGGSTDPKVFEALQNLNKADETQREAKKGTVTKLVEEMKKHGITFLDLKEAGAQVSDIDKLFDANTIRLAAGTPKATRAKRTEGDGTPKEKGPSKALMIALPANGKRPAGYGKGDADKLGTYTKPAFKELFTKHGDKFESVMEGFRTDEGKAYYATPEGKKEWTAIIDHIKTKKAQPVATK